MSKKHSEPATINIFAPRFPGDLIEIIGNRGGLERLIDTLIGAVNEGRDRAEVCTSDGFSSELKVTYLQGPRRPEEWRQSGSPHWDIDDPVVARILDLTEENRHLRQTILALRGARQAIETVDYRGDAGTSNNGPLSLGGMS